MHECTEEIFLKDVAKHKMTVLLDNGVYRHLHFSSGTFNMHFTLTTWPGYLAITGDMGAYVFTRIDDMFEFFRHKKLGINPSYWAEKCEASEHRHGHDSDGIKVYENERFKSVVMEYFNEHEFESEASKANCLARLQDEVLCAESEYEAHDLARQFQFKDDNGKFELHDFWERNLREWTYHYIWCCYAIAWGILKYDEEKSCEPTSPVTSTTDTPTS